MIIKPLTRGLLCATAHPDGCALRVRADVERVRSRPAFRGARNALIIGCSAGLGLATRMALAFGAGTSTIGVCRERPGGPARSASAGWYNTAALETELASAGRYGRAVVGDAFSDSVKALTSKMIRQELGHVDLVVYSVAAPHRKLAGETHRSTLKATGVSFTDKSYDATTNEVVSTTMPAATLSEVRQTISVMGGDDWMRWMETLADYDALAPDVTTVAFSYVGNDWLAPSYRSATIGKAKEHLEWTARSIDDSLRSAGGRACTAVMRALVTQASGALPIQNLYAILLLRVAHEMGLRETVLDQTYRLLASHLYVDRAADTYDRIRMDDWEMSPDVQSEIRRRWNSVSTENLAELGAPDDYRAEALALYGFGVPGVEYGHDTDPEREIPGAVIA